MALVLMTPFFKGSHLQQQATQSNTSNSLILFIKAQTTVAIFTYFCCQMFSGLIFCLIIYSTTLSIESSRLSIYSPFCSFFIINEARNCSYRFFVIGFDSSIDIAFIIGSMKLVSSPQQGLSYLILPSESWKDQTIQSILQFHDQCLQKPFPLSFQQFHSFWQRQRLQNLINNTHKLPNQQTYLAWLQYHYAYLQQSDWVHYSILIFMENEYDLSLRMSLSAYFCLSSERYCSYDLIFSFKAKISLRYYSIDFSFFFDIASFIFKLLI